MPIPTDFSVSAFSVERFDFSAPQVAISQAAVAMKINANQATSGTLNITGRPALWPGWIIGLGVVLTANKTAGVMTFTPTINGTALTFPSQLVAVAVANATKQVTAKGQAQIGGFSAGDLLGVKLTTDGSYAPTTNDVEVELYVIYGPINDL